MSFFKRLKNVVSAKANKALEKHEDPICANFIATVDNIRKDKVELIEKASKYEEAQKDYIKRRY